MKKILICLLILGLVGIIGLSGSKNLVISKTESDIFNKKATEFIKSQEEIISQIKGSIPVSPLIYKDKYGNERTIVFGVEKDGKIIGRIVINYDKDIMEDNKKVDDLYFFWNEKRIVDKNNIPEFRKINILNYWDKNGFNNLQFDYDRSKGINLTTCLWKDMKTSCIWGTPPGNFAKGICYHANNVHNGYNCNYHFTYGINWNPKYGDVCNESISIWTLVFIYPRN